MSVGDLIVVWLLKGSRKQTRPNKSVKPSGGSRVFCLPAVLAAAGLPLTLGYISAEPQEPQVCCTFNVMSRLIPCLVIACIRSVVEALACIRSVVEALVRIRSVVEALACE